MKKIIALLLVFTVAAFVACGGGGSETQAKGEAKIVAKFMDNIAKKGDLTAAFDMLHSTDKAMLGMMPGFYDFITGKETEAVSEDMLLARVAIEELTPLPEKLIKYSLGDPQGEGDTLRVPVQITVPKQGPEELSEKYLDPELLDQLENMEQSDMSFDEKKALIKKAISQFKDGLEGDSFETEDNEFDMTLIKENGEYKISILAGGLMDMLGGGGF